jgi:hypothetical protein
LAVFLDGLLEEVGEEGFDEGAGVGVVGDGGGEGAAFATNEGAGGIEFGVGAEVAEEVEGGGGAVGGGEGGEGGEVGLCEAVADGLEEGAGLFGGEAELVEEGVEDGGVEVGEEFVAAGGEGEEGMGFARTWAFA